MKALIIPSQFTTTIHRRNLYKFKNILKSSLKFNFKNLLNIYKDHLLSTESYFYSHFPEVLGSNNVFILGHFYKEYTNEYFDEFTRYPSINKNQICNFLSYKTAVDDLTKFDFILIGIRSSNIGRNIAKLAKKKNIPVVILDYFDDKQVYQNHMLMHRGLKYGFDFDIFFKHDIPLDYQDKFTFPLAPMPIDPNSYLNIFDKNEIKKYDIFYRGRNNHGPRDDRKYLSNILKQNFKNSKIENIDSYEKISLRDYCKNFAQSKLAFSPSGKVWDSTRHTETAIYGNIPILPIPDCKITGSETISSNHAILYNPAKIMKDGVYLNQVIERIKFILNDERKYLQIANNWKNFVLSNHTLSKKSEYIINSIKLLIK